MCCSCETNKKFRLFVFLARGSLSLCYFYFLLFAPCRLCVYIGGGEIPVLVVLSLPLHHDIMFFEFQFGSRSAPSDRATTRDRETAQENTPQKQLQEQAQSSHSDRTRNQIDL